MFQTVKGIFEAHFKQWGLIESLPMYLSTYLPSCLLFIFLWFQFHSGVLQEQKVLGLMNGLCVSSKEWGFTRFFFRSTAPRSYGKINFWEHLKKKNSSSMLMWLFVGFAYQGKGYIYCVQIHCRVYSSLRDFDPQVINRSSFFYMRIFFKDDILACVETSDQSKSYNILKDVGFFLEVFLKIYIFTW